ncbi:alkylated DNA repair protein AlkB [Kwoniella sp. DSM 27419]
MTSVSDTCSSNYTAFRLTEKHFKNRAVKGHLPSLRRYQQSLVDLSRPSDQNVDPVWQAGWWSPENDLESDPSQPRRRKGKERAKGERPELDYSALERVTMTDGRTGYLVATGCVLIPGYLSASAQLDLLHSSLTEFTLPPNPLSLTTHYDLPPDLFNLYTTASDTLINPKHLNQPKEERVNSRATNEGRRLIETEPASVLGYDEIVARNKTWTGDVPSDKLNSRTADQLMRELRWANLGWVYQWSTKSYDFSRDEPIPFPPSVANLCSEVVASIPWHSIYGTETAFRWDSWPDDYAPDTGIVNFYQLNDTLMAHVDRSELDPARPLVSVSLGHAAILLLGTTSRDDPPRPVIVRSGDCLVMSGIGRQAYHGVPRILEGSLPAHFGCCDTDSSTMRAVKRFISTARVNINARQVFPPGFSRPSHSIA